MQKDGRSEHDIDVCIKVRENMKTAAHKRKVRWGADVPGQGGKHQDPPTPVKKPKLQVGIALDGQMSLPEDRILFEDSSVDSPLEPSPAYGEEENMPSSARITVDPENDFNYSTFIVPLVCEAIE